MTQFHRLDKRGEISTMSTGPCGFDYPILRVLYYLHDPYTCSIVRIYIVEVFTINDQSWWASCI